MQYPITMKRERERELSTYNMIIVRKKIQVSQRKSYDGCDKEMLFGLIRSEKKGEHTNRN